MKLSILILAYFFVYLSKVKEVSSISLKFDANRFTLSKAEKFFLLAVSGNVDTIKVPKMMNNSTLSIKKGGNFTKATNSPYELVRNITNLNKPKPKAIIQIKAGQNTSNITLIGGRKNLTLLVGLKNKSTGIRLPKNPEDVKGIKDGKGTPISRKGGLLNLLKKKTFDSKDFTAKGYITSQGIIQLNKTDNALFSPELSQLLVTDNQYIAKVKEKSKLPQNINPASEKALESVISSSYNMSLIKNNTGRIVNSHFPSIFNNSTNRLKQPSYEYNNRLITRYVKKKLIIPLDGINNVSAILQNKTITESDPYLETIVVSHPQTFTLSEVFSAFLYKKLLDIPYTLSDVSLRVKYFCPDLEPVRTLLNAAELIEVKNISLSVNDDLNKIGLNYTTTIATEFIKCKLTKPTLKLLLFDYKEKAEKLLFPTTSTTTKTNAVPGTAPLNPIPSKSSVISSPIKKPKKKCQVLNKSSIVNLMRTMINILIDYKKENAEMVNLQESIKLSRVFLMHLMEYKRLCQS